MATHEITRLLKMSQTQLYDYVLERAKVFQDKGYSLLHNKSKKYIVLFPDGQALYPVLASHLDIKNSIPPDEVRLDGRGVYTGYRENQRSVLGGDDRCGVWAMLELLESSGPRLGYIFSTDEEDARKGAAALVESGCLQAHVDQIGYFLQLDRCGIDDMAYYELEESQTHNNDEFKEALSGFVFDGRPYSLVPGTNTDIVNYCEATGICGINLSAGYYNEHHEDEYVDSTYLMSLPDITLALIDRLGDRRYRISMT